MKKFVGIFLILAMCLSIFNFVYACDGEKGKYEITFKKITFKEKQEIKEIKAKPINEITWDGFLKIDKVKCNLRKTKNFNSLDSKIKVFAKDKENRILITGEYNQNLKVGKNEFIVKIKNGITIIKCRIVIIVEECVCESPTPSPSETASESPTATATATATITASESPTEAPSQSPDEQTEEPGIEVVNVSSNPDNQNSSSDSLPKTGEENNYIPIILGIFLVLVGGGVFLKMKLN